jgi:hypothetical protein
MKETEEKLKENIAATSLTACEDHEWVVFSTALQEGWLMVQCVRCQAHATIDKPSQEDWQAAFHAPSKPYRWSDESRLTIRGCGPICVIARQPGTSCECIEQGHVAALGDYERVPGGIMVPERLPTQSERADLSALSDSVLEGGLCSRLLAVFLQGIQEHMGFEPSGSARHLAQIIDEWDRNGLHMSPGLVARIVREWARYREAQ